MKSDVSMVFLTLLNSNSNSKLQLKTVFSSFKDVKVIQFSSMQDAFLGFTEKASPFVKLLLVSLLYISIFMF